jgi:hypothetical protein
MGKRVLMLAVVAGMIGAGSADAGIFASRGGCANGMCYAAAPAAPAQKLTVAEPSTAPAASSTPVNVTVQEYEGMMRPYSVNYAPARGRVFRRWVR